MPPLTVMIKPASSACNMRCTYCFYADVSAHRQDATYGVMSETTLQNLVRRAFAYAEGQVSFLFQGGEPTLAGKDFFRRFLALERQYNTQHLPVQNSIQTNGYAIDKEWCSIFREGRFLVGVSVDGTSALHDACRLDAAGRPTYARIAKNIELLKAERIEYNILCVVNQPIASAPAEVFKALAPHRFLQFIPCLDGFDGERNEFSLDSETYGRFLIQTYDLYEKAYYSGKPVSVRTFDNWIAMLMGHPPESCGMSGRCGRYYLVEANGNAYPCDFYVLDEWLLGNVNDASFYKLDKSPVAEKFLSESVPLPEQCRGCAWLSLCCGGCRRDREPYLGGQPSPNRLCAGLRMFFEQRMMRMQTLAKHIARTSIRQSLR